MQGIYIKNNPGNLCGCNRVCGNTWEHYIMHEAASWLKVWHTCWCTPQSHLSSSWPLRDQCMSITCFVRAVSPSLVGRVHVHTLTVNIQVVGGQVEGKNHGLRLQDGVFIWCFYFSVWVADVFEDIRITFLWGQVQAGGFKCEKM